MATEFGRPRGGVPPRRDDGTAVPLSAGERAQVERSKGFAPQVKTSEAQLRNASRAAAERGDAGSAEVLRKRAERAERLKRDTAGYSEEPGAGSGAGGAGVEHVD